MVNAIFVIVKLSLAADFYLSIIAYTNWTFTLHWQEEVYDTCVSEPTNIDLHPD